MARIKVIGGGLAGCECAWGLAERGHSVDLFEMRPQRTTAAHHSSDLGELVCSNSFRSSSPTNAVGLLKAEMAILGSPTPHVLALSRIRRKNALVLSTAVGLTMM
jgi:methylenetetrahydrofolate--tRNA-(uracil-5-)-methyltransferase